MVELLARSAKLILISTEKLLYNSDTGDFIIAGTASDKNYEYILKVFVSKHWLSAMRKYIKATLIFFVFSSLFGGSYAFTSRDIDPILRDYLFWGMIPLSGISVLILGVLVILDDIKNSKHKNI